MASRSVCWRAGTSRAPPVSSGGAVQPLQQRDGGRSRTRAAASSMARGRPSSRRQISATTGASSVGERSRPTRVRPLDEQYGSPSIGERRERCRLCASGRQVQRRHREDVLPADAERRPARHQDLQAGQRQRAGQRVWGGPDHLLEVVERPGASAARAEVPHERVGQGPPATSRSPSVWAIDGDDEARVETRGERDEVDAVLKLLDHVLGGRRQREPGLPGATRPDQGDEAAPSPAAAGPRRPRRSGRRSW